MMLCKQLRAQPSSHSTSSVMQTSIFTQAVDSLHDFTFQTYKHLTENPELSWKEFNTTRFLATELDMAGIPYRITKRGVGLIIEIKGREPGSQTVIIRGDIDNLPIVEKPGKLIPSQVQGVSAACGHSAHAAMTLTAIKILWEHRSEFRGTLLALLQPAEELINDPGCMYLIEHEGLLDYPNIIGAFALHCTPEYLPGDVHLKAGEFMASANEMRIRFLGKPRHVQYTGANTIIAASAFINDLHTIKAQHVQALDPLLLAPSKIKSSNSEMKGSNILPDSTEVTVVFRVFKPAVNEKTREMLVKIADKTAEIHGCKVEYTLYDGIPPVKNDPALTHWAEEKLSNLLGREHVKPADYRLGGDDICFLSQRVPLVYIRLGSGGAEAYQFPLHDAAFQVNPACLDTGVRVLVSLAFQKLQ